MDKVSAVDPSQRPSVRSIWHMPVKSSPPPPSSAGTPSAKKPYCCNSLRFAATNVPMRSQSRPRFSSSGPIFSRISCQLAAFALAAVWFGWPGITALMFMTILQCFVLAVCCALKERGAFRLRYVCRMPAHCDDRDTVKHCRDAERPNDVLSEVLRAVRLTGSVFLDGRFTAPFGVISPQRWDGTEAVAHLRHVSTFHLIARGRCTLETADGERHEVGAGDVLMLPFTAEHRFWQGQTND